MSNFKSAPLAAFRHRGFRYYQVTRLAGTLGLQVQSVAVGWQVYEVHKQPLELGYVGLVQFAPALGLALLTGHVADRFDRRRILLAYHVALLVCAAVLMYLAACVDLGRVGLWPVYAVLLTLGTARAFAGPAAQAILANLVPGEDFGNAVAWNSTSWEIATVLGPALGGFVYGLDHGAVVAYGLFAALVSISGLAMVAIRLPPREASEGGASWERLLAGVHYVRNEPVLLGAISLDLFAVLLGGAVALLPIYARDILHVGPAGLGGLRSAPACGAAIMAIYLAFRPLRRRAGTAMLIGVAIFGLATCVFALSTNFYLSLAMLVVVGASDLISVFVRQSLVQLRTPDAMRGRVAAVNQVFVGASNELGEFESGITAAWWGTVPATLIGGVGTILVVGLWSLLFPALRREDDLRRAPEKSQS